MPTILYARVLHWLQHYQSSWKLPNSWLGPSKGYNHSSRAIITPLRFQWGNLGYSNVYMLHQYNSRGTTLAWVLDFSGRIPKRLFYPHMMAWVLQPLWNYLVGQPSSQVPWVNPGRQWHGGIRENPISNLVATHYDMEEINKGEEWF